MVITNPKYTTSRFRFIKTIKLCAEWFIKSNLWSSVKDWNQLITSIILGQMILQFKILKMNDKSLKLKRNTIFCSSELSNDKYFYRYPISHPTQVSAFVLSFLVFFHDINRRQYLKNHYLTILYYKVLFIKHPSYILVRGRTI